MSVSLTDYQCGAKATSAAAWDRIREAMFESGFAWDVDVVDAAGRHGLVVQEVPIKWVDRAGSTVPPLRTSCELGCAILRIQRRRCFDTDRSSSTRAGPRPDVGA